MSAFGDSFISPFAIALKATNLQIALLTSVPGLAAALFNTYSPNLTEKLGRKRVMVTGALVQSFFWAGIIVLPVVAHTAAALWLIGGVTFYQLLNSLINPAWSSIMSQHLPHNKRGQYFSWRSKLSGLITLISTFAAGYVMHLFPRESLTGFIVIFSIALVCRLLSWFSLTRMIEPRVSVPKPGSSFTFLQFIGNAKHSNFGRFVIFVSVMSFAVNLSGPFFSVYMLRELKFDYMTFVTINAIAFVATFLSLSAWGKYTDRAGSIKIISLTGWLVPVVPVLWLVSPSKIWLLFAQVLGGFVWAGYNLAVSNFMYDSVSEEKRVRCISYYNMINGLCVFLGASAGGLIVGHLPAISGSRLLTIFLLSGLARLAVRLALLPTIKEVRKVKDIPEMEVLLCTSGLRCAADYLSTSLHGQKKQLPPVKETPQEAPIPVGVDAE
jgi:MFS family permease